MILKQGTFMKKHTIRNLHNNISGLKELLEEDYGYEKINYILDDLKYAYENDQEDYLMNLVDEFSLVELIKISENWNILTDNYPVGKYEKI